MRKRNRTPGLYRRGKQGIWYVQKRITVNGESVQISESTGTTSYEEAERFLTHRIQQLRNQRIYGIAPKVTLIEAADKFLDENQHLRSIDRHEVALRAMVPELGGYTLDQLHNGTVQPYVRKRLESGVSAGTVNREIAVLVRILNLAARSWRDDAGNPYLAGAVPMIERASGESRKPYPLNHEEQERLLKELPEHLQAVTKFGLHTGARASEITNLKWSYEVMIPELGVTMFVVPSRLSKNGEERVIVLNSEARRVVEAQRGKHPEYVFVYEGRPMDRVSNTAWKKACSRAGLPIRFHDCRHTTGHRLRAVGAPEQDVASILGHTTGTITTHYSAADLGNLLAQSEKLVDARPSTALRTGWFDGIPRISDKQSDRIAALH